MRYLLLAGCALLSTSAFASSYFELLPSQENEAQGARAIFNAGGFVETLVKCDKPGAGSLYIKFVSKKLLGAGKLKNRYISLSFNGTQPYKVLAEHDGYQATIDIVKKGSRGGTVLSNMMNASKMEVQMTSQHHQLIKDSFDLTDSRELIGKAFEACGDSY